MIPKEKAKELVDRYYWTFGDGYLGEQHIQCALIAVDEILKTTPPYCDRYEEYYMKLNENQKPEYWDQVKEEINKL